jgi:hypothetical protein
VFEESSAFHTILQAKARQVAQAKYDLAPDWECGFGQAEYEIYMSEAAKELVDSSRFMHHGIDDQVRDCGLLYIVTLYRVNDLF